MDVNVALWLTVTTVEAAADVLSPLAISLAETVAVAPAAATVGTVTTPAALTVATAVFDELKLSLELGGACVEPSL
jgi:hypothetical protein